MPMRGNAGGGNKAYLEGLNPEQKDAVLTLDGPILVLAGAGTGKTRVLTCRLAHILNTGSAYPSQILSVTFTNKAAREMRERVGTLLGAQAEGLPWLGTFHSIAAKILRIHAELVGLKSSFTILDTDDQIRLLKQIIKAADIDEKRWTGRYLAALIDGWKNKGLTPDKLNSNQSFQFADGRGSAFWRKARKTSALLVMTTSRFMGGAGLKSTISYGLKKTFLARKLSNSNVIIGRLSIFSARPLD